MKSCDKKNLSVASSSASVSTLQQPIVMDLPLKHWTRFNVRHLISQNVNINLHDKFVTVTQILPTQNMKQVVDQLLKLIPVLVKVPNKKEQQWEALKNVTVGTSKTQQKKCLEEIANLMQCVVVVYVVEQNIIQYSSLILPKNGIVVVVVVVVAVIVVGRGSNIIRICCNGSWNGSHVGSKIITSCVLL